MEPGGGVGVYDTSQIGVRYTRKKPGATMLSIELTGGPLPVPLRLLYDQVATPTNG